MIWFIEDLLVCSQSKKQLANDTTLFQNFQMRYVTLLISLKSLEHYRVLN